MREDEAEVAMLDAAAKRNVGRISFSYDPTEDHLRRREFALDRP